jgi:hypothetical protein
MTKVLVDDLDDGHVTSLVGFLEVMPDGQFVLHGKEYRGRSL